MLWQVLLALSLAGDVPAGDTLTLKQAVSMALASSPEMRIVEAQQAGAKAAIAEGQSSFIPTLYVGSGAAYTRGTLQQIENQPPALAQAAAVGQIFNLPQKYAIREARANAMAVSDGAVTRRDELIWRVASTYADLDRTTRALEAANKETDSLLKLQALTLERVKEGQEIPSEGTKARLSVARHRQRLVELEGRASLLESTMKSMLSLPEERHIRTVADSLPAALGEGGDSQVDENHAIARALENSPELKRLAHEVEAKEQHVRSEHAQKYPSMELIAQYAFLTQATRFETFSRFTPNNVQMGTQIKIPLFNNARVAAREGEANAALIEVRNLLEAAKRRIILEVRQGFQQSRLARASREVARLELELARENTSVVLALFEEGRAGSRELEQSRLDESGKWNALLEAGFEVDRSRLAVLRVTGEIGQVLQ